MARKGKYQLSGLEQEIDELYKVIESLTGKIVTQLPQISTVPEGAKFKIRQADGTFTLTEKINGVYMIQKKNAIDDIIYWEEI